MLAIKNPAQPKSNGRSQVYAFPTRKPVASDLNLRVSAVHSRNPQSVFALMVDNLQKLEELQRRLHVLLNELEELDQVQV